MNLPKVLMRNQQQRFPMKAMVDVMRKNIGSNCHTTNGLVSGGVRMSRTTTQAGRNGILQNGQQIIGTMEGSIA